MKKRKTIFFILIIILTYAFVLRPEKGVEANGKIIIIDPGHGGKDPGTIGLDGTYEKDINLELSLVLKKELEERGYRTIILREEDNYIHTRDRAKEANSLAGDLLLSIHCNYVEENPSIEGVQILHYKGEDNEKLASLLMGEITKKSGGTDKGVIERNDLQMLFDTKMPALIIEAGFLSNRREGQKLQRPSYQKKLSKGIGEGLDRWYGFK